MTSTPAQFAKKLRAVVKAVDTQDKRAILERAKVTKTYILAAAAKQAPRQVRPSWVKIIPKGDIASVYLWGGYAHIFELGSYHQPGGYPEWSKATRRRAIGAARRSNFAPVEAAGLMRTPYGALPYVHHPRVAARHFWQVGLERSCVPGHDAYRKVILNSISDALK